MNKSSPLPASSILSQVHFIALVAGFATHSSKKLPIAELLLYSSFGCSVGCGTGVGAGVALAVHPRKDERGSFPKKDILGKC